MIDIDIQKKLKGHDGEINLDLKIRVEAESLVTLYGPSGAGKTSILRMISGLMSPDEGKISVSEIVWFDHNKGINLSPQQRKVGLVFQDFSLFPNMTIRQNLQYAQDKKHEEFIDELLEIMSLSQLQNRLPSSLSGGQKQRVALARAIAQKPKILLLDEPLSALDRSMRMQLQSYLMEVHTRFNLTTILVSHDISEILKLSNQIVVVDEGKVVNRGLPSEIFLQKKVSGKFQFTGEIIDIDKQGFIFIVSVLIGNDLVRVIADENEMTNMSIGDNVMVASKAFNPIIQKIER